MATDDRDRCPTCAAERPANAPPGLCPRCLLRAGLDGDALSLSRAGEVGATLDLGGPPSVVEALAASVGPVPRVLLRDTDLGSEPPLTRPGSAEMPSPETRAGKLRLLGEMTRGGMGAILKGRDEDLGRDLAVKVLLEAHRDDPDLIRRFVEEAQIAGQLQHPGIVPIYELGTFSDRRPYFAMKLVKGQTLAAQLAARPSPLEGLPRFLGIFEQACQTVAYAHARGVIHRDLKPSNVMVGSFGEVQVMDWGLAKVLPRGGVADDATAGRTRDETVIATARSGGTDSDLSHAGSVLGTPAYMAPEQARGEVEGVDERADVFALGSMLCEALTGQPAFTGRSSGEIQRKAARGETADALARLDGCAADAELVALARDCLAAEREDRPRDARAVADRVTAYLTGVQQRVQAAERERAVAETKAIEERRRRKLQVGLAASLLTLTTVGGLAFNYVSRQKEAQTAAFERALTEGNTLLGEARKRPADVAAWRAAIAAFNRIDGATLTDERRSRLSALKHEAFDGEAAAAADEQILSAYSEATSRYVDAPSYASGALGTAISAAGYDVVRIDPRHLARNDPRNDPRMVGEKIRARPQAIKIAAALDLYASLEGTSADFRRKYLAVARIADPDPIRAELRALREDGDLASKIGALRAMASRSEIESWPVETLNMLAAALDQAGDAEAAIKLLRGVVSRFPESAWANLNLARLLERADPPRYPEAIRYFTAARALQPSLTWHLLRALAANGDTADVKRLLRDPVVLNAIDCRAILYKAREKRSNGASARDVLPILNVVILVCRDRIERDPRDGWNHVCLGAALWSLDKRDDAIAAYRNGLGRNFEQSSATASGISPVTIDRTRELVRDRPDDAGAHFALGWVLGCKGQLDEAEPEYRKAIQLNPNYAEAFYRLGGVLHAMNRSHEAVAAYREAVRCAPSAPGYKNDLAHCLMETGELGEALKLARENMRLLGLGHQPAFRLTTDAEILLVGGRFTEAIPALENLLSRAPLQLYDHWATPATFADLLFKAEQLARQGDLLQALAAKAAPSAKKPLETVELAKLALDHERPGLAALLYDVALTVSHTRAENLHASHRYNAARAAVLAAAGKDVDDPKPDDVAKSTLRRQALEWLKAERDAWAKLLDKDPKAAAQVAETLRHWQSDADLAVVRDTDALAKLLEPERADWKALWAEVHRLQGEAKSPP